VGRWWRGAPLAVCLALVTGGVARAAELRALEARQTSAGADVRIVLSAAARPVVRGIADGDGRVVRIYVDLPRGTRLGRRVARRVGGAGPVDGLRIGATDDGSTRVLIQLAEPATFRVRRAEHGAVVVLSVARAGPAAGADRAAEEVEAPPEPPAPVPQAPARVEARAVSPPRAVPAAARLPPPALGRRWKIVLDPGHGGRDPGAQGVAVEKQVTLNIARRLAELLRERLGAEIVLTRDRDATVSLAERTARANAEQADLFVSIHANAGPHARLAGIETYYLDNTDDHATIRLARLENGPGVATPRGGQADLRYILSDLVQVGKMEESIALLGALQEGLVGELRRRYDRITDLGVKRGPFYVLVGAHMPCVLVEVSFLTNPTEGRRLAKSAYRHAVAEGLYAGVARFLAASERAHTL
jgi:N-acetylmuramoyl-L-alanine amidase